MYHGPREEVLPFFESVGFHLPGRKGVADFLQASLLLAGAPCMLQASQASASICMQGTTLGQLCEEGRQGLPS